MKIVIPTYRRPYHQATFDALPPEWKACTTFIVDAEDAKALQRYAGTGAEIHVHPPDITTIAKKRAYIVNFFAQREHKIVMFDDDLSFSARVEGRGLPRATREQIDLGLRLLEEKLETYIHAGITARMKAHILPPGWIESHRMMYVLGYRPAEVQKHCELGRIETREDMDITLQLLRKGFNNAVYTDLCVDQKYAKQGGCDASGRTVETSNADALKLAELHPGFVKVKQKDYVTSVPRMEVVVQWRKAYESSQHFA